MKTKIDHSTFHAVEIRGFNDDGKRYIKVRALPKRGAPITSPAIPWADFRGKGARAMRVLADAHIVVFGEAEKVLLKSVTGLDKFRDRRIAERPGWCGDSFVLADGSCISVGGVQKPLCVFPKHPHRVLSSGTLKDWVTEVAAPYTGHSLAEFTLMVAFAAPLRRFVQVPFNFGLELSDGPSTGKTTLLKACASAVGPVEDARGGAMMSMNATGNAIDSMMPQYSDQPIFLDEGNLMTLAPGGASGQRVSELVFRMSAGETRRRYGRNTEGMADFIWITTTNQPWRALAHNFSADIAKAAADRMITLEGSGKGQTGYLRKKLLGNQSLGTFCSSIAISAKHQHGTAMRAYVQYICNRLEEEGEEVLSGELQRNANDFEKRARNHHVDYDERVVRVISLIYTAGVLAVEAGVLPSQFRPMHAAMMALQRIHRSREQIVTPVELLLNLSRHPAAIQLRPNDGTYYQDAVMAPCLISRTGGRRELLLTGGQMARLPMPKLKLLRDPQVAKAMVCEEGRLQAYRRVADLRRERVYCFQLEKLES